MEDSTDPNGRPKTYVPTRVVPATVVGAFEQY